MLGPFATASRRTPHCHSPGFATVARRYCRTPHAHRCPQQRRRRRQQRQRVTEGTAMAPQNGRNDDDAVEPIAPGRFEVGRHVEFGCLNADRPVDDRPYQHRQKHGKVSHRAANLHSNQQIQSSGVTTSLQTPLYVEGL